MIAGGNHDRHPAAKTAMVAAIALFASLVAFGNVTDYSTNFAFVQHVLSMDTIFEPRPSVPRDRQPGAASCGLYGHHRDRGTNSGAVLDRRLRARAQARADGRVQPRQDIRGARADARLPAVAGRLHVDRRRMVRDVAVEEWNGVPSAFRFVMVIIAVLIFVAMPDQDLEGREAAEAGRLAPSASRKKLAPDLTYAGSRHQPANNRVFTPVLRAMPTCPAFRRAMGGERFSDSDMRHSMSSRAHPELIQSDALWFTRRAGSGRG